MDTSGFYRKEGIQIIFADDMVAGGGYTLLRSEKDLYVYPIDGWIWFDSQEEAEAFFSIEGNDQADVISYMTQMVQKHLDDTAKTRGYDNIMSLCTYITDPDQQFAFEGQAGVNWRSSVWRTCYNIMGAVQQGLRPIPTIEQLLSELPDIEW